MASKMSPEKEAQNKKYKEEMAKLRQENKAFKESIKQMKKQVKLTTLMSREFNGWMKQKDTNLKTLEEEIQNLKKLLQQKEQEYADRVKEVEVLKEVLDDKDKEKSGNELSMEELRTRVNSNNDVIQTLTEEYDKIFNDDWIQILDDIDLNGKTLTRTLMMKNKVESVLLQYQGIPDSLRGRVWMAMVSFEKLRPLIAQNCSYDNLYYVMLQKESECEKMIQKDILRSFPSNEFYAKMLQKNRIEGLNNVLRAYSNWDPALGYCQGMNFVVSFLLLYLDQENAFLVLLSIMYLFKMCGVFQPGPILPLILENFEKEFRRQYPKLCDHFETEGVRPLMFATEWFTTLFVYNLPVETVAAIWDYFFYGDGLKILYKTALALLGIYEEQLLKQNMEQLLGTLKKKIKHVNVTQLMKKAHHLELSEELLLFLKSIAVAWKTNPGDSTVNLVCYIEDANPTVIITSLSGSSTSSSLSSSSGLSAKSPTSNTKFTHHK